MASAIGLASLYSVVPARPWAWAPLALFMFVVLGAAIRRLHDLGHPDWLVVVFLLVGGLPIVRAILPLYLVVAPGRPSSHVRPGRLSGVLVRVLAVLSAATVPFVIAYQVPRLIEARVSANEARTISDIRAVFAWQENYRAHNGGYYESRADCLWKPTDCIPRATLHPWVDTKTLLYERNGYVRELIAGPPVPDVASGLSRTSSASYALIAHPIRAGVTGVRSFCGDYTGRICVGVGTGLNLVEGTASEVRCSKACETLQ